jgi:hypothetical protein
MVPPVGEENAIIRQRQQVIETDPLNWMWFCKFFSKKLHVVVEAA